MHKGESDRGRRGKAWRVGKKENEIEGDSKSWTTLV